MPQLIVIGCLFFIGWLLQRSKNFPDNSSLVLNQYVIYISLPALILAKLPYLEINSSTWQPVAIAWFGLMVGATLVIFGSFLFNWSRSITGAMLVVVPLGNTSFVGLPMIQALIGEQGIPTAILFDQLGSFLALIFYGTWVIAYYSGKAKPNAQQILTKILSFPPFWAMLIAFFFASLLKNEQINQPITMIGNTLVPVILVALGMQFKITLPTGNLQPLVFGLSIKLILIPLAVLTLVYFTGWHGMPINVSILESAMAPMISAGALVIAARLAPELAAGLVCWGLLVSFFTVPIWHWFIS